MANDRIRIHCKKCGADRTIYKFYPSIGSLEAYMPDPLALEAFFDEHVLDCHGFRGKMDLGGEECFELSTESIVV